MIAMLARSAQFEGRCDVCGATEAVEAADHAEAWDALKRAGWCVRKNALPVVHVCPECPVDVA